MKARTLFQITGDELIYVDADQNLFIDAPEGSGKHDSIVFPMLEQYIDNNFSGVIIDNGNNRISSVINSMASANGTQVINLDLDSPERSFCINPLQEDMILSIDDAKLYAAALVYNKSNSNLGINEFLQGSVDLIASVIWYLKNEIPEMCSLPHLLEFLNQDLEPLIIILERREDTKALINTIAECYRTGKTRQLAGYLIEIRNLILDHHHILNMYPFTGKSFPAFMEDINSILIIKSSQKNMLELEPIVNLILCGAFLKAKQNTAGKRFFYFDSPQFGSSEFYSQILSKSTAYNYSVISSQDCSKISGRISNFFKGFENYYYYKFVFNYDVNKPGEFKGSIQNGPFRKTTLYLNKFESREVDYSKNNSSSNAVGHDAYRSLGQRVKNYVNSII